MSGRGRATLHAIVLAAGASSRFGSPKQLVRFQRQPLIQRVIALAHERGVAVFVDPSPAAGRAFSVSGASPGVPFQNEIATRPSSCCSVPTGQSTGLVIDVPGGSLSAASASIVSCAIQLLGRPLVTSSTAACCLPTSAALRPCLNV